MSVTGLRIRLAVEEDVERLTGLHLAVFSPREHLAVLLGEGYVRATHRWAITSPEAYTLVAEAAGGELIGFLSVCDRAYTLPRLFGCLGGLVWSLVRAPSVLGSRPLWRQLGRLGLPGVGRPDGPGRAQVMVVAVAPAERRGGVFQALVGEAGRTSRERGSRALCFPVREDNRAACRAYTEAGFHPWRQLARGRLLYRKELVAGSTEEVRP